MTPWTPGFPVLHYLRVCSNSCPLVSDAIQPSHPQSPLSLPVNLSQHQGLFQCWFFASGGQSIGASAPPPVLPKNVQSRLPLGWAGWISLQSQGLSRVFSSTTVQSINSSVLSLLFVQLSYPYMTTGKTIALTIWTFVDKVMSLLFNILSRFVVTTSKEQACFYFMATVTIHSDFGSQENEIRHCFHFFPFYHEVMGLDAMIVVFWIFSFKPAFPLS